ncbi:MAG: oligosaccharide flippase family protein [Bacteroidia bacterium]|nr:oligosaccharide flippase family protein [Bacteroidia bacterium]
MGVIRRQSLKFTVVNFAGTILGALSVLFIYPLDDHIYGYANYLYATASLLIPLAGLGINGAAVRFFREFKNDDDNNGFVSLILMLTVGLNLLFVIGFWLFHGSFYALLDLLNMDVSLVSKNQAIILVLVFLLNLVLVISAMITNYRRIVVPAIIQTLGYKIYLPIAFLLCYFGYVNIEQFAHLIPLFYAGSFVLLVFYLYKLGGLKLTWRPKFFRTKIRSMLNYMMYTGLSSLGSRLIYRIDSVMVSLIVGLTSNGLYNRIFFMANVVAIPTNSIHQIANPIISEHIQKENWHEVSELYRKSSTNLFLIGAYLFVCLTFCLPEVFSFAPNPEAYQGAMAIFLFLGASRLVEMLSGLNAAIINFSQYYRYNLLFTLILGGVNIVLNYYLINDYGVVGAAMASFFSLALFNLMKYLFVLIKLGIQPFDASTLKIAILFGGSYLLLSFFHLNLHPIINITAYGGIISLVAVLGVLYWNISEDARSLLVKYMNKLGLRVS